jgi:hypothetical protein
VKYKYVSSISLIFIVVLLLSACGPAQYTLKATVIPEGAGTITPPDGIYNAGIAVTVVASPTIGYAFDYWSGDATGTTSSVTVSMNGDKNIIANFKKAQYSLNVSVSPDVIGSDTVHIRPGCCTYPGGTNVTLGVPFCVQIKGINYNFDHWSGDASGTDTSVTIVMDSDKNIVANFREGHTALLPGIGCCAKFAQDARQQVQTMLDGDTGKYVLQLHNAEAGMPKLVTLNGVPVWEVPVLEYGTQLRGVIYVRLQ